MQLLGLILLLATTWYLVKVTSKFLDEQTKNDISNSFNILKNNLNNCQQILSKAKIREAWEKYKEEGGVLFNRDKS